MNPHDATEQAYKSPIEILKETIIKETDDNIYKAVLGVAINVDKDELIKALEYDRQQYENGYDAGYKAAKDEIVRCKDCKYCLINLKRMNGLCMRISYARHQVQLNDFCSFGERKED